MSRTKNGTDLSKAANVAASMTKASAVKRGRKPTIHEFEDKLRQVTDIPKTAKRIAKPTKRDRAAPVQRKIEDFPSQSGMPEQVKMWFAAAGINPEALVRSINGLTGDVSLAAHNIHGLSPVAITGSYQDLSHKPEPAYLCGEPKCEHRPFYFEQEGSTDEEPMELGAMPMRRLLPEVYHRVENAIKDVQTLDALLGHHLARRFPENAEIPPLQTARSLDGQSEYEHALLGVLNLVEKLKREIELIRLRVR